MAEAFSSYLIFSKESLSEENREEVWRANLSRPEVIATIDAFYPPVAIEQKIEYTIPGVSVLFQGYIDCITRDGTIVDFKTAARKWSTAQHDDAVPLSFYLRGAQAMGLPVSGKMQHIVLTVKGEVQSFEAEWSPSKYRFLEEVVRDVDAAVVADVYTRNPSSCFSFGKKCPYYAQCRG